MLACTIKAPSHFRARALRHGCAHHYASSPPLDLQPSDASNKVPDAPQYMNQGSVLTCACKESSASRQTGGRSRHLFGRAFWRLRGTRYATCSMRVPCGSAHSDGAHGRVGEQRRSVRPVHFASSQRGFTCAHTTCTAALDFSDFCLTVPSCRQQACSLRVRAAPRLFCATVWSGGPSHTCFSDVVDCICAYLFRSACFSTRVRVMYSGGRRSEPRAAQARGGD